MYIAWTSVEDKATAAALARRTIELQLAVCVQIESPVTSIYRWNGRIEENPEYRLTFKCLESKLSALEEAVLSQHPYETPEWIVVRADRIGEKYLSWAKADPSTSPL